MPPKKALQLKEMANSQTLDADSAVGELTVASLEATLQKFFSEADKHSKDRFERLENQLDSIKMTLEKHSNELESQRKITNSLQTQMQRVMTFTTEHNVALKKLQDKFSSMEDRSRRNNLRIINLKEGVEQGNALSYFQRCLPVWFPELASNLPELMRAHRVGPPRSSSAPPRAMILSCLRFTDRDRILGFARKNTPVAVDGRDIRFTADYSDATARLRRPCFPVMNRARVLGFEAFLMYPAVIKLSHGAEQIQFGDPTEAAKFLDSIDPHDSSEGSPLLT